MTRHGILTTLVSAGMLSSLAVTAAQAEKLRTITYLPPAHFGVTEGMTPFMDCVKSGTAGAVEFDFFPGGSVASGPESLGAVQGGLAQIAYIVPQQVSDKMPLTNVPVLPNMGNTAGEIAAAYRKALATGGLLAGELASNDLTLLFVNQYPPYQVGFRDGRVDTMDGFKGKKLRVIGGSAASTATVLDAVPVTLTAGDVYVAVQQGTIDGIFFPVSGMKQFNLNEVMKAISSNANFGGSMGMVVMDKRVFDAMPADQQKVMLDCGMASEERLTAYQDGSQADILAEFAGQGIEIYEFSPEMLAELSSRLDKTAAEFTTRLDGLGLPGSGVYKEYRDALGR